MTSTANRHRTLSTIAAVLGVVIVTLIAHQALAAAGPTRPSLVATVDLERLFDGLQARAQADASIQSLAEELDAEGKAMRDEIEAIRGEIEIYAPGSDKYNEAMEMLSLKVLEFDAYMEFGRRKIDVKKAQSIKRIYLEIKDAIRTVAQSDGYDVVLVDDSVVELQSGTEVEVKRNISARRILYASPTTDITDDLIARMNA